MEVEFLIIGQGISGTWLSYYLEKANRSFIVLDNEQPNSASRVAAGIINPVTGRRIVKTWMIDELLSFLIPAYEELGKELDINAIDEKSLIDFHPTPQMKIAFDERVKKMQISYFIQKISGNTIKHLIMILDLASRSLLCCQPERNSSGMEKKTIIK
jgi:glycine/D-amino acid oxidase-like deaminating enzyme